MVFIQGTRFTRGGGTNRKGYVPHPDTRLLYLPPPHLLTHSEPPTSCCSLPIGPATSSKPRPLYKYHVLSSLTILHTSYPAYVDGTDGVFRNVGIQQSDAGEVPKRIHTRLKTRRKFEIKNTCRSPCNVRYCSQKLSH